MASRRDIKDAFYDELVTAATATHTVTYEDQTTDTVDVPATRVTKISPDALEELPAVVYDENYLTREINGVGNGPDNVRFDDRGIIEAEEYHEYVTAQYDIYISAYSDVVKEPIYEATRRAFGKYNTSAARASDLHDDVEAVRVPDVSSNDAPQKEVVIRGDQLTVEVDFHRVYESIEDVMESIDSITESGGIVYEDSITT